MAQPSQAFSFVLDNQVAKAVAAHDVDCIKYLIRQALPLARAGSPVGALGLGSSGKVYLGVNVEFPGLPLHHSIHAGQFLIANLALNSEPKVKLLVVSKDCSAFDTPCPHCCKFFHELDNWPEIKILITVEEGEEGHFVALKHLFMNFPLNLDDLLNPRHNSLIFLDPGSRGICLGYDRCSHLGVDRCSLMKCRGLTAANNSFAPYSKCPSGVVLKDRRRNMYRGWYMESFAQASSLGPVQAALVDFVANGGGEFDSIVQAVLVEKKDATVGQEDTARMLLKKIAPDCVFEVFHCCSEPLTAFSRSS